MRQSKRPAPRGGGGGEDVWVFFLGLRSIFSLTLGCHRSPRLGFLSGGIDHGVAMWEHSRGFQPTGMVPVLAYVSRRDTGSSGGIGTIAGGRSCSGVATRHGWCGNVRFRGLKPTAIILHRYAVCGFAGGGGEGAVVFFPRAALDFLAYPELSSFTPIGVFERGD